MRETLFLEMPSIRGYSDKDGFYHVAFSLSTTQKDAHGDILSDEALEDMVDQAKKININANHRHDLNSIIGPVTDAWLDKKDDTLFLWVDVRVRRQWGQLLRDLVEAGVQLGGSLEANLTSKTNTKSSSRLVTGVKLLGGAITDIPANRGTHGTLQPVKDGCPGSKCNTKEVYNVSELEDKINNLLESINEEEDKLKDEFEEHKNVELKKNIITEIILHLKDMIKLLGHKTAENSVIVNKEAPSSMGAESVIDTVPAEENITDNEPTAKNVENTAPEVSELLENLETVNTEVEALKAENNALLEQVKELKDQNTAVEEEIAKKKHDELVEKALNLNAKLNPDSKANNEETLIGEIKTHFQVEEDVDVDLHLENYVKLMELSLKKIPRGQLPRTNTNVIHNGQKTRYTSSIKKLEYGINNMGVIREEGE
jgi:TolA-binding protein